MEKAMSICRKESEDEQTTKKGKEKKVDWFVFLTDDILLDILTRLPYGSLRYMAKYVCKRWLDLLSNMKLLDHASFILQKTGNLTARHVDIREEGEGLQVKVQDLDIPRIGMIRCWDHEFLLISEYKERKVSLYVYNIITKEGSYLPEFKFNASYGGYCINKCGFALSLDRFKGIYKVVHLFMGPPNECHVLISRKDIASPKWKKFQVPCMNSQKISCFNAVSVQGRYFHWNVRCDQRLISIYRYDERGNCRNQSTFTYGGNGFCTIFEMGGSLALFAGDTRDTADIWTLKDFERKKWEKLQSVTLENWCCRRFPVCGVMSNKYIILDCKVDRGMCYYDLKNGVVKKLDIYIDVDDGCVVHSSPPSS